MLLFGQKMKDKLPPKKYIFDTKMFEIKMDKLKKLFIGKIRELLRYRCGFIEYEYIDMSFQLHMLVPAYLILNGQR